VSGVHRKELLLSAIACCDLTTLEEDDDPTRIAELARRAVRPSASDESIPSVAALCTWWHLTQAAVESLQGTDVKVAAVAGDFPTGRKPLEDRILEVETAVGDRADEVDVVINRGLFLSGGERAVYDEVLALQTVAGNARMKVILETGELGSLALVRRAALVAMAAGADMVKTSTGKSSPGATPESALVMADAIVDFHRKTNKRVGLKVSGGIRSADDAAGYVSIARSALGGGVTPDYFRIGASSLLDALVGELEQS
jgi:deoxyribose-phosphate aldolase